MRKLCLASFSVLFILIASGETMAQFNRNSIKRNNKRIASYRGRKSGFGHDKIYNMIGFSVSALNYYGDIAPLPKKLSTDISFTKPALAVSFAHRFGPRYTLQAQFMYGGISASDSKSASQTGESQYRYARNLSFRNRIKELSVVAYFDLFENQSTYISRVPWTPYVYIGIAGFISNPQAQAPEYKLDGVTKLSEAGQWVNLRPLKTEGKTYGLVQAAIPFGVGARFRLNEVFDLWADLGFRYTFTDYLDDVSGNYVAPADLKSDLARAMAYRTNELGAQTAGVPLTYQDDNGVTQTVNVKPGYGDTGNKRGTSGNRDIYMVTSIRLTYILGATFHKAKFR